MSRKYKRSSITNIYQHILLFFRRGNALLGEISIEWLANNPFHAVTQLSVTLAIVTLRGIAYVDAQVFGMGLGFWVLRSSIPAAFVTLPLILISSRGSSCAFISHLATLCNPREHNNRNKMRVYLGVGPGLFLFLFPYFFVYTLNNIKKYTQGDNDSVCLVSFADGCGSGGQLMYLTSLSGVDA